MFSFFGRFKWFRRMMPKWLLYEKYSQALAVAMIDKMLGVNAIFALTSDVEEFFPSVKEKPKMLSP